MPEQQTPPSAPRRFGSDPDYLNKGGERSPCPLHPNSIRQRKSAVQKTNTGRAACFFSRKTGKIGQLFNFWKKAFMGRGTCFFFFLNDISFSVLKVHCSAVSKREEK